MTTIIKSLYNQFNYAYKNLSDPRAENLLLMQSPLPIFIIVGLYFKFVLNWGPRFMKNRKPYKIDKLLIVYNAIQILCSANILYRALKYTYGFGGYSLICEPVNRANDGVPLIIVNGTHDYFLLKLFDLMDTIFFVLRKKSNQISFLHLYHHAGMVGISWMAVKFLPGGQSIFTGFLNCGVHIVMYSYYLFTAINKNCNVFWWKKYITQIQIIQFLLIELNAIFVLGGPECGYPKFAASFLFLQNSCLISLFFDFYYKTYVKNVTE